MKTLFISLVLVLFALPTASEVSHGEELRAALPEPIKAIAIDKSFRNDSIPLEPSASIASETQTFYATWPAEIEREREIQSNRSSGESAAEEPGESAEGSVHRLYTPFVQNIAIVEGDNPNVPCPPYYGKINVDLNLSAGGPYIFICYGKADSIADALGAIEAVTIDATAAENPLAKTQGCRLLSNNRCISYFVNALAPSTGDLNHGVGGAFIYLAKSIRPCTNGACDPGANPTRLRVRELAVVTGLTMDIPCPPAYTKLPIDLNQQTAGTTKIFLCQLLKAESE